MIDDQPLNETGQQPPGTYQSLARLMVVETTPGAGPTTPPDDRSQRRGRNRFARIWAVLPAAALLGAAGGFLIYRSRTPIYSSSSSLGLDGAGRGPGNSRQPLQAESAGDWDATLHTKVRIIESRLVRDRADKKLRLIGVPGLPPGAALPHAELSVRAVEPSKTIEIICESPSATMAATYSNAVAEEFIDFHVESRTAAANRASTYVGGQLTSLRANLDQAEKRLREYLRKTGLRESADQTPAAEEKLSQLRAELSQAESDRISKQSTYELAVSDPTHTLSAILEKGAPGQAGPRARARAAQSKSAAAGANRRKSKAARGQARAADPAKKAERERAAVIARLRTKLREAERRERALTAAYARQSKLTADLSRDEAGRDVLKRELERIRGQYDGVLMRGAAAFNSAVAASGNAPFVVARARVPDSPVKPSLTMALAGGTGAGALVGALLVFAAGRSVRRRRSSAAAGGSTPYGYARPTSAAAGPWPIRQPKVIVVTSANRGEGKSLTTGNLGTALAEAGKRVLMIDADMRKPELHTRFGASNDRGLSDLPRDASEIRDMPLEGLVWPTATGGLHLLPAGPGLVSMASLLHSDRMKELIGRFRDEYDTVLIDTPPLRYLSDAAELGRLADGAILVVRNSVTTREAALAAKKTLVDDGIHVLGTVLSDLTEDDQKQQAACQSSS